MLIYPKPLHNPQKFINCQYSRPYMCIYLHKWKKFKKYSILLSIIHFKKSVFGFL